MREGEETRGRSEKREKRQEERQKRERRSTAKTDSAAVLERGERTETEEQ